MKSPTELEDQVKSLVYEMLMNESDFHRLFGGILKVVFSFFLVESYKVNRRVSGEECIVVGAY